ncbi:hypothetical protein ABGV43_11500 [Paenibacillus amylolyticus]
MKQRIGRSWLLILMHGMLGIGAIVGGVILIIDPSGSMVNLPASLLENSPFASFLFPGIILLLVLGAMPIMIAIALIRYTTHWAPGERLNLYPDSCDLIARGTANLFEINCSLVEQIAGDRIVE